MQSFKRQEFLYWTGCLTDKPIYVKYIVIVLLGDKHLLSWIPSVVADRVTVIETSKGHGA